MTAAWDLQHCKVPFRGYRYCPLNVPGSPRPCAHATINRMTLPAPVPEIPAANVDKAAAYYVNTLGFTFDWGDDQGEA